MQKHLLTQTIAMSVTALIVGVGCSSDETSTVPEIITTDTHLVDPSTAQMNEANRLVTDARLYSRSTTTAKAQAPRANYGSISQGAILQSDMATSSDMDTGMALTGQASAEETIASMPAPAIGERHADIFWPPHVVNNTEKYQDTATNPIVRVADESTSTFSIDVDTGSYANMRRFLNAGQLPPSDAIRVEELLNYFSYDYTSPDSLETPFSIHTEIAPTPWNDKTRLLHIGLKGYSVDAENRPPANLVFLLDVSGSMAANNKLGLLKSSLLMLSKELSEQDSVSIVVYAGASGTVLEPTSGNNYRAIEQALKKLNAGGSTNGESGIELAYAMAEKAMSKESINRIILATDGDFNVGVSDIDTLKKLIEDKRESGIALTTLGFGTGNYNDHLMEQLADVGNGNYAYIDTLSEARKVLSEELTSTLLTIAKDVKIQIEFNPSQVSEYRLLGYVNRRLANEDFANDKVDAGEIGSGHTVTALYEIALVGEGGARHSASRYQNSHADKTQTSNAKSSGLTEELDSGLDNLSNEIAEVRLRFKRPGENKSQLTTRIVQKDALVDNLNDTSENFRFSAAVAGFGQLLRQNKYLEDFDFDDTAELAASAKGQDRFGYRAQFVGLVDLASSLHEQRVAATRDLSEQNGDNSDEGSGEHPREYTQGNKNVELEG